MARDSNDSASLVSLHEALLRCDDPEIIAEILRQAESRLDGQLTITLAADMRSVGLMAIVATVAAGAVGSFVTASQWDIKVFSFMAFLGFMASAVSAYRACAPREIRHNGNFPRSWMSDIEKKNSLKQSLAAHIVNCQDDLVENHKNLKARAARQNEAALIFLFTIFLCAFAAAITWPEPAEIGECIFFLC